MLHRIAACALGWALLLALAGPVQAFGLDSVAAEVSSAPNMVYGLYLGQPYEEHVRQCSRLSQESWTAVANGLNSGKRDVLHPAAIYWCERGPKVREKLQIMQDGETNTLRQIEVIFTSDDISTTRYIADTLYRNISDLGMELVEDHYTSGVTSYIEWRIPDRDEDYRVRVEYQPGDENSRARAIVIRYVNDEDGLLLF